MGELPLGRSPERPDPCRERVSGQGRTAVQVVTARYGPRRRTGDQREQLHVDTLPLEQLPSLLQERLIVVDDHAPHPCKHATAGLCRHPS